MVGPIKPETTLPGVWRVDCEAIRIVSSLLCWEILNVKKPLIFRVAPDRKLENWKVIREGDKEPHAKGMTKSEALKVAARIVHKKARPATVLVHKTRYIIERALQFSG